MSNSGLDPNVGPNSLGWLQEPAAPHAILSATDEYLKAAYMGRFVFDVAYILRMLEPGTNSGPLVTPRLEDIHGDKYVYTLFALGDDPGVYDLTMHPTGSIAEGRPPTARITMPSRVSWPLHDEEIEEDLYVIENWKEVQHRERRRKPENRTRWPRPAYFMPEVCLIEEDQGGRTGLRSHIVTGNDAMPGFAVLNHEPVVPTRRADELETFDVLTEVVTLPDFEARWPVVEPKPVEQGAATDQRFETTDDLIKAFPDVRFEIVAEMPKFKPTRRRNGVPIDQHGGQDETQLLGKRLTEHLQNGNAQLAKSTSVYVIEIAPGMVSRYAVVQANGRKSRKA